MKQIEYTKEQQQVIEVLKPFKEMILGRNYIDKKDIKKIVNDIEIKYNVKPSLLTLREYLEKNSIGAYHNFIFTIKNIKIDVIGVSDFERLYNKDLLDEYYVVSDKSVDNGGDCCNYDCKHYLTLEEKED